MTSGFSHPCHLDVSIFIFRGLGSNFSFLFHFSMKIMSANRIATDGTPRFAASHLGLYCLTMSDKKDARLIWDILVREINFSCVFFSNHFLHTSAVFLSVVCYWCQFRCCLHLYVCR